VGILIFPPEDEELLSRGIRMPPPMGRVLPGVKGVDDDRMLLLLSLEVVLDTSALPPPPIVVDNIE
jgi:hypothetical protein